MRKYFMLLFPATMLLCGCVSDLISESADEISSGYKGVSVSGTTYCNGFWATSGISGGSAVSLSQYSGGGGGGRPGGGGGWPW